MSVRTSLAIRRGTQIFGGPRTPVLQAAVPSNLERKASLTICCLGAVDQVDAGGRAKEAWGVRRKVPSLVHNRQRSIVSVTTPDRLTIPPPHQFDSPPPPNLIWKGTSSILPVQM